MRLHRGGGDNVGEVSDREHETLELLVPRVGSRRGIIGVTKHVLSTTSQYKSSSIVDITEGIAVSREDVRFGDLKTRGNLDSDRVREASKVGASLVDVRERPLADNTHWG